MDDYEDEDEMLTALREMDVDVKTDQDPLERLAMLAEWMIHLATHFAREPKEFAHYAWRAGALYTTIASYSYTKEKARRAVRNLEQEERDEQDRRRALLDQFSKQVAEVDLKNRRKSTKARK